MNQAPSILNYGTGGHRPGVIVGYRAYCIVMALIYLLVTVAGVGSGIWVMMEAGGIGERTEGFVFVVMGAVGLPLMVAFLLPFLVQRRPWLWVYGIVLIALGMTSVCTLPFCVWMLILWIREDCRAWFGWGVPVRSGIGGR